MAKPILLICGCRKYEEYLHAAIRRFARPEWDIVAILGGGTETVFDPSTNILTLAVADSYEALPSKIHAAFTWISNERPGIPGVFKTDDDLLLDTSALAQAIQQHADKPYWGIAAGMCPAGAIQVARIKNRFEDKTLRPRHQSALYCFGWGYWISSNSLPILCEAKNDYATSFLEDVCTGFVLNRAGIRPGKICIAYKEVPRGPALLKIGPPE